jgi:hypothetical protein
VSAEAAPLRYLLDLDLTDDDPNEETNAADWPPTKRPPELTRRPNHPAPGSGAGGKAIIAEEGLYDGWEFDWKRYGVPTLQAYALADGEGIAYVFRGDLDPDPHWRGYIGYQLGVRTPWVTMAGRGDLPVWLLGDGTIELFPFQVVFRDGSPLRATRILHPWGEIRDGVDGAYHTPRHPLEQVTVAWRSLDLLHQHRIGGGVLYRWRPGPEPGSGATFPTRESWYDALNTQVRPRQKRVTADEWEFAAWLGLDSPSTLFKYLRKWGPPHIQDLRDGRFWNRQLQGLQS